MSKFIIDVPPPTISGDLHIGHIFSYTQADLIKRYQEYKGNSVIYPFCFDNNGLSTLKLAQKKKRIDVIDFSIEKSIEYFNTFQECGIFLDNSNGYHTISTKTIDIVNDAFFLLLERGIIYKAYGEYLWSEKLHTSISQSELDENGLIEKTGETPLIREGDSYFVKSMEFKDELKKMADKINWYPIYAKTRLLNWIDEIKYDWNISRNRIYGVPIPNEDGLVFDTWFISALTPQLSYGDLDCPQSSLRFQGHDIIRSWAYYTMIMWRHLNDTENSPWKDIMVTGHVLDGSGNKFAKSNGNATGPKEILNRFGIHGIRWWAASCSIGNDVRIDQEKMKMGWRINNKFENAKKFIKLQLNDGLDGFDESIEKEAISIKQEIERDFENYNLPEASNKIYYLMWNLLCDKWIEESKKKPITCSLQKVVEIIDPLFKIIFLNEK